MTARLYVTPISEIGEESEDLGEKANLLIRLQANGFLIPETFLIHAKAYFDFIKENNLENKVKHLLKTVDFENQGVVRTIASYILKHMGKSYLPDHLVKEILKEYKGISEILSHANVHIYFSHPSPIESAKVKGDASLISKIKDNFLSIYSPNYPKGNPTLIIQKEIRGKQGKIRTSTSLIRTNEQLSQKEIESLEKMVKDFKKIFYLPYEIDWVIKNGKVYIESLKPQTHTDLSEPQSFESHFKIFKNSLFYDQNKGN